MAFLKVLDRCGAWLALNNFLFKGAWLSKTFKNCSSNLEQLLLFYFVRTFFRSVSNFEESDCFWSLQVISLG